MESGVACRAKNESSHSGEYLEIFPERYIGALNGVVDSGLGGEIDESLLEVIALIKTKKQLQAIQDLLNEGFTLSKTMEGKSLLHRSKNLLQVVRGLAGLNSF